MITVAVFLLLVWHPGGYVSVYVKVWEMLNVRDGCRDPELGSIGGVKISLSISSILSGIVREVKWEVRGVIKIQYGAMYFTVLLLKETNHGCKEAPNQTVKETNNVMKTLKY